MEKKNKPSGMERCKNIDILYIIKNNINEDNRRLFSNSYLRDHVISTLSQKVSCALSNFPGNVLGRS